MRDQTLIAVLRGINVGGKNLISMGEPRAACSELGWEDVRTYINSGNLVFRTDARAAIVEAMTWVTSAESSPLPFPSRARR